MTDNHSPEHRSRFPKLNDVNYHHWSMRQEADLVRLKLWDVVQITVDQQDPSLWQEEYEKKKNKRSAQKMAEARAEMIMHVEDGQLSHMRSRDPMEIWEKLAEVHKARGFATQLAMKRRFLTAKKRTDQAMQAWIGDVRSMAFRMEEAGITVNDQDKILAITMGLPSTYDPVIISFDATPTDQLTLEVVISRLLNEEVRQTSNISPTPTPKARNPGVAAAVLHSEPPKSGGNGGNVTCFFCGQVGHYKSDCPERAAWEAFKAKKAGGGQANAATAAMVIKTAEDSDDDDSDYAAIEEDGAW